MISNLKLNPKDPLFRLKSYRPKFKEQARFMADPHRMVGLVANAQSGKTFTAAPKFISRVYKSQQARGNEPMRYWIVVSKSDIAKPLKSILTRLIPRSHIDWKKQGNDTRFFNIRRGDGILILRNGAILEFKSFATGEALVAATLGGIWVDEAARCNDEATWGNLFSRLNVTKGWMLMTTSPTTPAQFYKYVYKVNQDNPEFGWHKWDAYNAAAGGIGSFDEIEAARKRLAPHIFQREFLANWITSLGTVYDNFDRKKHVTNFLPDRRFKGELYPKIKTFFGVDIGANHPSAISIISELHDMYQVHEVLKFRSADLGVILDKLVAKTKEYDPQDIFYDYGGGGAFVPSAWRQRKGVNHKILTRANKRKGSVVEGIMKIYQLLSNEQLVIKEDSCEPLLDELESYRWSDKTDRDEPVKENDDACDATRYGIATYINRYKGRGGLKLIKGAAA